MIKSENPYISVIIPSYNSFLTIKITIEHILKQESINSLLEILVVDSSDDDKTKEFLETVNSNLLKVITSGIKVMPGTQRNIGAKNAKGKLLVFVDSDAYPASDWLSRIHEAYSQGYMVGGGSYLIGNQIKTNHIIAQYYFEFGEYIPTGKIRRKKMAPTCNLFCDRELFLQVNGFPEIRASEDTLFGLNVNKISPVYFFPEIKVYHIFRNDVKKSLANQKLLGKYIIIFRKLYFPRVYGKKFNLVLLFPLIFFYKLFNTYFRTLLPKPIHFIRQNKAIIHFLYCLIWWTAGVIQGIFSNVENYNSLLEDESK